MDLDVLHPKDHDVHLIKVRDRLHSYYALQLENFLEPILRRARKIILECSDATSLSSAGIRVILSMANVLKNKGGGLILLNLQEVAKKVLRTSKTLDLFSHTNDPREAVRSLEGKKGFPSHQSGTFTLFLLDYSLKSQSLKEWLPK